MLELLQQRGTATTIAALAAELGVHPNTARGHLDALVADGLAVREQAVTSGRGRPAWSYVAAADRVEPDSRVREYAGLATALAAHIARTSPDPVHDALAAGRAWGRELAGDAHASARPPDRHGKGAVAARRAVLGLLDGLGFDPEADDAATTAALRRCPLLDAARRHPDVVCGVHLGLVRGAMDVLGGDPERTDLTPFAEPGACRLTLVTRA